MRIVFVLLPIDGADDSGTPAVTSSAGTLSSPDTAVHDQDGYTNTKLAQSNHSIVTSAAGRGPAANESRDIINGSSVILRYTDPGASYI